jgi:CheY-like chemotaxis protein
MTDPRHPYVLIVDDDADTRELYNIILEAVGCRVEAAGNLSATVERLAGSPPDVVLTDWRLPDGDGFAVADAVQAHHTSRGVPLVAVTGISMSPEMATEARVRGFTSVLLKPTSPDEILAAVRLASGIGTTRRLRGAAQRLRRYGALVSRRSQERPADARTVAGVLAERAAARSGEHIALMLADDTAHYVAAAGSARELTGYEPQELLALSVWDLTPPAHATSGEGLWGAFIASGSQEGNFLLRRRDGPPVEAQYCAIANVIPGVHVSAIALARQIPASL